MCIVERFSSFEKQAILLQRHSVKSIADNIEDNTSGKIAIHSFSDINVDVSVRCKFG